MMNECYLASWSSSVLFATLKENISSIVSKSCTLDAFKDECLSCKKSDNSSSVAPFVNAAFNTVANNFIIVMNRREVEKIEFEISKINGEEEQVH